MSGNSTNDSRQEFLEMHKDCGDRGAALSVFAILECDIDRVLINICPNQSLGKKFLKTLHGVDRKINTLNCLGLISDIALSDLLILKEIRNNFAHHLEIDAFSHQTNKDALKKMSLTPRESVYGRGKSDQTDRDEAIKAFRGNFEYEGNVYASFCLYYADLLKAGSGRFQVTVTSEAKPFKVLQLLF